MLPFSKTDTPFIAAEGEGWCVVFKPSGMDSVPLGNSDDDTLVSWLRSRVPSEEKCHPVEEPRLTREMGMMSRLDRETSGLILCARNPELFQVFSQHQSLGLLAKRYRIRCTSSEKALEGSRPPRIGVGKETEPLPAGRKIESYFRSFGEKARKVACVQPESIAGYRGKLSNETYITEILASSKTTDEQADEESLYVDVVIVKGFRHQIRAHMAWMGWPIDGDSLYGGRQASRLYLEACGISFPDRNGRQTHIDLYGKMA